MMLLTPSEECLPGTYVLKKMGPVMDFVILQEAHRNFWEGKEASKVPHSQDGEGPRLPWGSARFIAFAAESHSMSQADQSM